MANVINHTIAKVRARAAALVIFTVFLASCGPRQENVVEMPPQDADFIQLQPTATATETTFPGNIEGKANVDVKAQVSGYLEAIYVKEGDYVKSGKTLFKIKSDVYNEQVNSSAASLKAAEAAQASARLEIEKLKPLVEGQVVSDMQLKSARASYDAATAQVAQAKAALGSSRINAGFALIKAPVSGYIGRIPNRVGNLVTPNDAIPLTTLSDITEVFVYFSMSEAAYMRLSKGAGVGIDGSTEVGLITADGSKYAQTGRLESGSGNIDRNTGSYTMKAVFPNPDRILRSGGAGRVVVHQALGNAITVPLISVKDIQDKLFVYKLMDSNKVSMVPVTVAGRAGNEYILQSGLGAGDKIAVNRLDALMDGAFVNPKVVSRDSLYQ